MNASNPETIYFASLPPSVPQFVHADDTLDDFSVPVTLSNIGRQAHERSIMEYRRDAYVVR